MNSEQITEAPEQNQTPQAAGDEQSGGFEFDEDGQRIPHGQGQSKSSRRRRRKRKGKGADAAPGAQITGEGSSESAPSVSAMQAEAHTAPVSGSQATSRQSGGQQRSFQNNGQQHSQGSGQNGAQNAASNAAPGGTKRWKKKFRDRDRNRVGGDNPGNQTGPGGQPSFAQSGAQNSFQPNGGGFRGADTHQPGNGGGFKRKGGFGGGSNGGGKQRNGGGGGGRTFVGPMDHSYRVANGNVFDTSPSTIEPHGNGNYGGGGRRTTYQSDSQPIDYSMGRPIPINPDAPTKIYFFIEDLFFIAKIGETARKLGVKVAFVKNDKEQIAALTEAAEDDRPGLIVFDLNNASAKPMTLIPKLKSKLKKSTSIVGFLSHLQGDLKAKAVEAGCDTVMPRAAFSQNLPNLLRRYGIEDVEEPNFNQ